MKDLTKQNFQNSSALIAVALVALYDSCYRKSHVSVALCKKMLIHGRVMRVNLRF